MGFFRIKDKQLEILQKISNQLEENQTSKEMPIKSEADKLKAAYALNLCTVSVSQIIDYNDIYFLEREYEAILNNLNLEQMPKDEALLDILRKLLDVITYFRIQEGDKKMLEKKYQHEMKNAIWNAVPNLGLIVAGGNPVTMAISLASQVGIGYMNYRKTKAENELKREEKEWELQRSAMEQFNALRRELFTTAWRLAEEYNFPDEYRLTERQITQYNEILMDPDYLRRYERLEYIQNKFEAYPPYWYYLGNAANRISQDPSTDEELREPYRSKAEKHLKTFIDKTGKGLLREDHVLASAALELFDILPLDESNQEYKKKLLEKAVEASGNAYDVLQLCAMSYLTINEIDEATNILKMLVNSDYNAITNAQLLSQIYVSRYIYYITEEKNEKLANDYRVNHKSLLGNKRVNPCYLISFPDKVPNNDEECEKLQEDYITDQKNRLIDKYSIVVENFIRRYQAEYDGLSAIEDKLKTLSEMYEWLCKFPGVETSHCDELYYSICKQIKEKCVLSNEPNNSNCRNVKFQNITDTPLKSFMKRIKLFLKRRNTLGEISETDIALSEFCKDLNLPEPLINNDNEYCHRNQSTTHPKRFELTLISGAPENKTQSESKEKIINCMNKYDIDSIIKNQKSFSFYKRGEYGFNKYIGDVDEYNTIAILRFNGKFHSFPDLFFKFEGIYVKKPFLKKFQKYEEISYSPETKGKIKIDGYGYEHDGINIDELWNLINSLKECTKK